MVEPETFAFLSDLAANNKKAWLDANREARDDAMRNFTGMAMTLHDYADRFDHDVADTRLKPKQSYTKFFQEPRERVGAGLYRTGIDVFANAGDASENFGYYLHVEPGVCHAGAGLFQPTKPALARMRTRLTDDADTLDEVLNGLDFKAMFLGGIVTRKPLGDVPDGFSDTGPVAPYLKMSGLGCRHDLSDDALLDDDVMDQLVEIFRAARPLVQFFE
ncbi:MAG: DUF2461 family protein [Octadecabacter sp.]